MPRACPGCGSPTEYQETEILARAGHCTACDQHFTVLGPGAAGEVAPAGTQIPEPEEASTEEDEDEETEAAAEGASPSAPSGPPCPECGAPLHTERLTAERISLVCAGCDTRIEFAPVGSPPARAPRGGGRRGAEDDSFGAPPARPCRRCGGPLTFTTDADGNVVGECAACGNKFTLPPRRTGGYSGGGGRGGFRGRRPFRPGGGFGGPRRGPPRRFDRRGPPRDDDEERPRRRRSRDREE